MKLVTYRFGNTTRMGVVDGNSVIDINRVQSNVPADIRQALLAGVDLAAVASQVQAKAGDADRMPLEGLAFAPLLPEPGKIVCLGLNYYAHAKEGGREKPDYPWFFLRGATSLLPHNEAALRPKVSERFDYEAELAVIIGKPARHVSQEQALEYVFGYSCFNDISVRDYQKRTPQWTIGKNFDRTGGFGPYLVTADDLPPGAEGLKIQCRLNGEVMQDADTADMIWNVQETIAILTECMTLLPGDVIIMGTPSGVGQARNPPVWMKHGDRVEIDIEQIGVLVNTIQDEAA